MVDASVFGTLVEVSGPIVTDGWPDGAHCPAPNHGSDRHPSLSFLSGRGIVRAVKCHKVPACSTADILGAFGMTEGELTERPKKSKGRPTREKSKSGKREIDRLHNYVDERGELISQVVRLKNPKGFFQRRPLGWGGQFAHDMEGVRKVLYNLPLLQGAAHATIVEGEKSSDLLVSHGMVATNSPGGAGKWTEDYTQQLVAAGVPEVAILPDNDPAGDAHTRDVAISCLKAGLRVKVLALPGLREKEDPYDWFEAGHTPQELADLIKAEPFETADGLTPSESKSVDDRVLRSILTQVRAIPDDIELLELAAPLRSIGAELAALRDQDLLLYKLALTCARNALRDKEQLGSSLAQELLDAAIKAAGQKPKAEADRSVDPAELEQRREELRGVAGPVLVAPDPLTLVDQALRLLGYGGDTRPAWIVYLAVTSRLLLMRPGNMPAHMLLLGLSGIGKSYTAQLVLRLLPREAWHEIDAGSPRVLIYDPAPLEHRVVIFKEADSLPAGEDNPAASAVRNLLQDHYLHYKVVVRDEETGGFTVATIAKPGPTTMLTTAVKRLGPQLDTRLFSHEVPEDRKRIRAALAMRAQIEKHGGVREPDAALLAFQSLLQSYAPWDVVVPYAEQLSEAIGESSASPRILRDFERLLSLIKATTILRHQHRRQNSDGRWIAEVEDYATVFELAADVYRGTSSGASGEIRAVVQAVGDLVEQRKTALAATPQLHASNPFFENRLGVTRTKVARALELNEMVAWRRLQAAIRGGWLRNLQTHDHRPACLLPGEPLPADEGLPRPEMLRVRTPLVSSASPRIPVKGDNWLTGLHVDHAANGANREGCQGALTDKTLEDQGESEPANQLTHLTGDDTPRGAKGVNAPKLTGAADVSREPKVLVRMLPFRGQTSPVRIPVGGRRGLPPPVWAPELLAPPSIGHSRRTPMVTPT